MVRMSTKRVACIASYLFALNHSRIHEKHVRHISQPFTSYVWHLFSSQMELVVLFYCTHKQRESASIWLIYSIFHFQLETFCFLRRWNLMMVWQWFLLPWFHIFQPNLKFASQNKQYDFQFFFKKKKAQHNFSNFFIWLKFNLSSYNL